MQQVIKRKLFLKEIYSSRQPFIYININECTFERHTFQINGKGTSLIFEVVIIDESNIV